MGLADKGQLAANQFSLQIRRTLTDEIAREAIISSLAYSNLAVFLAVLFCFAGLSPVAAISYVSAAFFVFVLTTIIGSLYSSVRQSNVLKAMVVFSVIANELILSSIIVFDYFAQVRANTLSGGVAIVSISFISVHLCARFTRPMLVSKFVTIAACCVYIVYMPKVAIPTTEGIAILVVALLIMLATGYWIILRRRNEIVLQMQLQDLNQLTDSQNRELKIALDEKEKTQVQLEQEYSLRQKLISHIGHDLRQPISAASYMLMELQKQESSNTNTMLISDTTECINSASRMIEDIVQFTHFDNLEIEVLPEWVGLDTVLQQVGREYFVLAQNADCEIRCARTSLCVFIDPNLLKRVLRNLTTNVIKHSDATRMLLGVRHRAEGIEIWVVDNGSGLNNGDSESTIVPSAKKQEGLGLGIKISSQLAKACGANLSYTTQSGEGTNFKLAIPEHLVRRQGASR